jgi:predicted RNA-binding Zn-ribbon protein involved in translation (DUF1610 family)
MPDDHDVEAMSVDAKTALVYIPCPGCRKAVPVAPEARDDPEPPSSPQYECPSCGTVFVVRSD